MARGIEVGLLAASAALGVVTEASAATSLVVTRAESAADCPDAASLASRAAKGGARTPFVPASDPEAEGVVVAFERAGEERRARIAAPGGRTRTLVEHAPDCEGLAEAVTIALVLAADDRTESDTHPETPRAVPPAAEPAAAVTAPPQARQPWVARISAGAGVSTGVVDAIAPAFVLGGHLASDRRWRLGVLTTFVPPNDIALAPGSVRVAELAPAVDACWQLTDGVALEACARGEAGVLWGSARGFATTDSSVRVRWAAGIGLRVLVPLGRQWAVFAEGFGMLPAARQRFAVNGAGVAYDPPFGSLALTSGLSWSIW